MFCPILSRYYDNSSKTALFPVLHGKSIVITIIHLNPFLYALDKMCIRDRLNTLVYKEYSSGRYGFSTALGLIMFVFTCIVAFSVSVSYTHLDVYKRQVYDCVL